MSTKKISNFDFSAIIDRLMTALSLRREYELANLLGFKKDSFSARKLRNAVPVDKIRLLCKEKSINENWVFYGEGDINVVSEPSHEPYAPEEDRIPRLTKKEMECVKLMGILPEEEQDREIEELRKRVIEYLSGKKKK